ncbi:DUF1775 domain-containing protein [Streptomyces sp. NPDC005728]|uniref:DUF1775 domain-containing protein n=1 Tax=Streptomyces sp. NPDC005728 TaxID=3157054 RepID=UPI0033D9D559
MFSQSLARAAGRFASVLGTAVLAVVFALAGSAFAHVKVTADTPQALAKNVTLSFRSEAEDKKAGFRALRVILPQGIAPADVTLVQAPEGWRMALVNGGYDIAGPDLKKGVDLDYKVRIKQLPDARQLVFKTYTLYSDNKVQNWDELPAAGQTPQSPAPLLQLSDASMMSRLQQKATSPVTIGGAVAVLLLLIYLLWWMMRRRAERRRPIAW